MVRLLTKINSMDINTTGPCTQVVPGPCSLVKFGGSIPLKNKLSSKYIYMDINMKSQILRPK